MDAEHMRRFWDERAKEDAYFFVDDRRDYRDEDLTAFWAGGEEVVDRFLELLDASFTGSETVLDIGCGVGRLTRALAGRVRRVYGLDVSQEMLERAREHQREIDNVEWILGDGRTLRPMDDASVDVCFSHVVFQHIPDPRITLGYVAEMGRVLRPGGWAAFQVSNDAHVHQRRESRPVRRKLAAWLRRAPSGQEDPAWLGSAVRLDDLRDVAGSSGLELSKIVGEGTQFCLVRAIRKSH